MIRKTLLLAAVLVALMAGRAAAQYPPIVVSPGTVEPGGSVTITGAECAPNVPVTITLLPGYPQPDGADQSARAGSVGPDGTVLGTTTTGPDGTFSITVTIPAGTPVGVYTIRTECGSVVRDAQVNVQSANAGGGGGAGTGTGASGGNLPRTGSSSLVPLTRAGLVLLAAGGLVLLGTRRRRQSSPASA